MARQVFFKDGKFFIYDKKVVADPTGTSTDTPSATPTLDLVLAEEGALTLDRTIDGGGKSFEFNNALSQFFQSGDLGGAKAFILLDTQSLDNPRVTIRAINADESLQGELIIDKNGMTFNGNPVGQAPTLDAVLETGATLTANRIVDLANNTLRISTDGRDFLRISSTVDNEGVVLKARNTTGFGNSGTLTLNATPELGVVDLSSFFNDEDKYTTIHMESTVDASSITHTAGTHTFTGRVIGDVNIADNFANDAAATTGGVPLGSKYHDNGIVRINWSS